MSPLLSISAFTRTDATGGSRGEAMPERENIKQRVSESRAKRWSSESRSKLVCILPSRDRVRGTQIVWALPSGSCFDRRSNIVNGEKRMTDSFGHSNNFATLSQALTYNSLYIIKGRGHPRQDTAFLAIGQGRPHRFLNRYKTTNKMNTT